MKTVIEQLEAATAETVKLQGEMKALTEKITALEADLAKAASDRAADLEAHKVALADLNAKMDAANAAKAGVEKERDTAISERDEARKALKSPAFAVAGVRGESKPVADGGTPADAPKVSLVAQMKAIDDPEKRAAFYHANKEAIRAELKN